VKCFSWKRKEMEMEEEEGERGAQVGGKAARDFLFRNPSLRPRNKFFIFLARGNDQIFRLPFGGMEGERLRAAGI
jgi:hypothetical protein